MLVNEPVKDSPIAPGSLRAGTAGPCHGGGRARRVRLAAPVLIPVFFAVVLSLLFGPTYAWLGRGGLPKPVALVIMLVGMTLLFVVIFYVLGASIARFSTGIDTYSSESNERLGSIQVLADRLGLTNVNLREVVEPRALTGAVGVVLSGIAGFLSNLFLILMIVLFLLAEGPASWA